MSKAVQTANIEMVRLLFQLDEGKLLNHSLLELFDITLESDKIGPIDLEQSDYWGNTALHLVAKAPYKPYKHVRALLSLIIWYQV